MFHSYPMNILHNGIVLFWALWWSIVFIYDSLDFLQKNGMVSQGWRLSNNYNLLKEALGHYKILNHRYLIDFFYLLIILFVFIIAILFWLGFISHELMSIDLIELAFMLSFFLDVSFILFDELTIEYQHEHTHIVRTTFRLATFILYKMT